MVNIRYPSDSKPQVATYIKEIKEVLLSLGHDVKVVTGGRNWQSPFFKGLDMLLFNLEILSGIKKTEGLVYVNHPPYLIFSLLLNQKKTFIFHWHGGDLLKDSWFWNYFRRRFFRSRFNRDLQIVPSDYFKNEFLSRSGIEESQVKIIPTGGIDMELFLPRPSTIRTTSLTIGFASSISPEKGDFLLDYLIEYQGEIENSIGLKIDFLAIRYGVNQLKYATKWGGKVKWREPMAKNEMPHFYQEIDLLLFLTSGKFESLGLVGVEAMSCNVPVVGPNIFAVPEYVRPGSTGELYEPGDEVDLKKKLIRALNQIDDYSPRKFVVKDYSKNSVRVSYSHLFQNI